jgi:hypothetical protein
VVELAAVLVVSSTRPVKKRKTGTRFLTGVIDSGDK